MLDKTSTELATVEESLKRRSKTAIVDFIRDFPHTGRNRRPTLGMQQDQCV